MTLEVQFELAWPGSQSLTLAWEYWDGEVWRAFKAFKPTATATRAQIVSTARTASRASGIIRLVADCAATQKKTIGGVSSDWLRARLTKPLPPTPGLALPLVDRISLRTVIIQPFTASLRPDAAFADSLKLDLGKSFYPFGQQPLPGAAFYFASQEAFSKAGNKITLSAHGTTPQDDSGAAPTSPAAGCGILG